MKLNIKNKLIEIDDKCVPLVKYFNEIGLDTKYCCQGHNDYENFNIMFEEYITDEQMINFISEYSTKHKHSPFLGKFVKWYRKMSGEIVCNWMYIVNTYEEANVTYNRLISNEFKVK
ncbi:hypothetical protein [Clostridium botulinum]|uniref:hypothetical protein n=1 Tax=Clostridium botulinum TaxID=1491 RepID=UPI0004ADC6C4|nr:hypothetical protein [Clostridium botulinum]QDY27049.1 hypothetical protein CGQ40_20305 [Clostridium botulinum]